MNLLKKLLGLDKQEEAIANIINELSLLRQENQLLKEQMSQIKKCDIQNEIHGNFSVDSPTFVVDSVNNKIGIGTATPGRTLSVVGTGNPFEVESNYPGDVYGSGCIGPAGIIGYWNKPVPTSPGDYVAMVNCNVKDSNSVKQEYGEIGIVIVNPLAGHDESRMMFNVRGGGDTFLEEQTVMSITPISNAGSIIRFGPGEPITSISPTAGGGYLFSINPATAGMSAGVQYDGTNYIARTADPIVLLMGFNESGSFQVCTDKGIPFGSNYTPTPRLTVKSSGEPFVHIGTDGDVEHVSLRVNGPTKTIPRDENPVIWLKINVNGTDRYLALWD